MAANQGELLPKGGEPPDVGTAIVFRLIANDREARQAGGPAGAWAKPRPAKKKMMLSK